jgi:hypothetical protein
MQTVGVTWLKNAEAANVLAVSVRTLKAWMRDPAKREALGAVRHGKQWKIPRPENLLRWETETRERLSGLGVCLTDPLVRDFKKLGRHYDIYHLEFVRLFIGACLKAASRGPITQNDKDRILDLWHDALTGLAPLAERGKREVKPSGAEIEQHMDNLKSGLPVELLPYWPDDRLWEKLRAARTLKALERIRQRLDFSQALSQTKHIGQDPTAENVRPRLHKDVTAHINDTGEQLPSNITVKAHTPEELRCIAERDYVVQLAVPRRITERRDAEGRTIAEIEIPPGHHAFVDMRQPQEGIPLRTFRKRFPKKGGEQRQIEIAVFDIRENVPGPDEKPQTGKTPLRGSGYSQSHA